LVGSIASRALPDELGAFRLGEVGQPVRFGERIGAIA